MDDWITNSINSLGYMGIALLMFLENIVPPIPSEVIMPAAGYASREGELNFLGVVLAGTVGSLLGALPWYYVARWLGGGERLHRFVEKRGKWLPLSPKEYKRALYWFDRWGTWAVLFGRLIPTVRTLISVPAGIARMPLGKFLVCSAAGSLAWNVFLAAVGWFLGHQSQSVGDVIGWVGVAVLVAAVVYLGYRYWSQQRALTT